MQARWKVTAWLACLWFVSLLYGEYLAFVLPSFSCAWPSLKYNDKGTEKTEERPIRVVLIADPQLTDRTTHGMARGSLALRLTQLYSDIYMLRAFRTTVLRLKPDRLIFLGDYFDGGSDLTQDEWHESLKRFEHIFGQPHGISKWRYASIPVHYLAGNHDLGYVQTHSQLPEVLEQYESSFGSANFRVKVGGVEFIFVNAQVLDGPEFDIQTNRSWNFIQHLAGDSNSPARVLLTHIPLYRPDDTLCGPHRASAVINQRIRRMSDDPHRISYQNYLTQETSKKILASLNPVAVFSGHDHDQCETTHVVSGSSYVEHTVGTFSWQNGNIFPSFMLLTVAPASAGSTPFQSPVNSSLCFLPVQLFIYIWYVTLFVISVVAIFTWPAQGVHFGISWERFRSYVQGILNLQGPVKEKIDVDTEWEMVWDAEGAMHLISKGHVKIPDNPQGLSSDVRGSAQARPAAAKRLAANESDGKPVSPEDQNPSAVRLNKSKGRSCMRRFFLGMGPLAALVSWAFGLYVMLLMKDWSETEGDRAFG